VLQSAAVATGNGTVMDVAGLRTITVQVAGITSATVTWEVSVDGSNWVGILAAPPSTGTGALTTTADGVFSVSVAGFPLFRARISAWASGAITITAMGVAGV
jgi:hypothetical protein